MFSDTGGNDFAGDFGYTACVDGSHRRGPTWVQGEGPGQKPRIPVALLKRHSYNLSIIQGGLLSREHMEVGDDANCRSSIQGFFG